MLDRLSSEPIYNTRAVVQRSGVPADTFRAWERRYGVPQPSRSSGNQRLYSERDIAVINWLRDQTKSGMTISQAIALLHLQVRLDSTGPTQIESEGEGGRSAVINAGYANEAREALVNAMLHLDGARAEAIFEEALSLVNVESVCLDIMQGALVQIGHQWERHEMGVGAEHFASAFVHRKFSALFNQSNPNEGRGPIMAACPAGEQHELGLLLTSLFLSRRGYKIVYLGANMPQADLVDTARRVRPVMVLLSASREETAIRIAEVVPLLREAVSETAHGRPDLIVGFGGYIFATQPELSHDLHGTFLGVDARDAVANVDRVFAANGF